MKIIAIIPARYDSIRFPGKLLTKIKTKPVLQWVYESAVNSGIFDEVVISTGDQIILDCLEEFKAQGFRNQIMHICGTERCAEASRNYQPEDIIVNIQGDEIALPAKVMKQISDRGKHLATDEILTLSVPFREESQLVNPDQVKVVTNLNNLALYFSRSVIPHHSNPVVNSVRSYRKHVGVYAYRNETLQKLAALSPGNLETMEKLEQLRWLENGYAIRVLESDFEHVSINRPEDLEKAEELLAERE